jgi:hypothetical protein
VQQRARDKLLGISYKFAVLAWTNVSVYCVELEALVRDAVSPELARIIKLLPVPNDLEMRDTSAVI